jgi:hypothetical protein
MITTAAGAHNFKQLKSARHLDVAILVDDWELLVDDDGLAQVHRPPHDAITVEAKAYVPFDDTAAFPFVWSTPTPTPSVLYFFGDESPLLPVLIATTYL